MGERGGGAAPGSENNHICLELTAIIEQDCVFHELLNLRPAFQLDLPISDELTGTRVCIRHTRLGIKSNYKRGETNRGNIHQPCSTLTARTQCHVCHHSFGTHEHAGHRGGPCIMAEYWHHEKGSKRKHTCRAQQYSLLHADSSQHSCDVGMKQKVDRQRRLEEHLPSIRLKRVIG